MGYRYFDDQRLWDLTVEVFTRNGYSRSDCEDILWRSAASSAAQRVRSSAKRPSPP